MAAISRPARIKVPRNEPCSASIIRAIRKGATQAAVAERFGVTATFVRNLTREHDAAGRPHVEPKPRRRAPVHDPDTLHPRPSLGVHGKPGYEAWQLIHVERVDVRTAVKRLGLRWPSEVFELLAEHKLHVEALARRLAALRLEADELFDEKTRELGFVAPTDRAWVDEVFDRSAASIPARVAAGFYPNPEDGGGDDDE